jgi:hypothetical protein
MSEENVDVYTLDELKSSLNDFTMALSRNMYNLRNSQGHKVQLLLENVKFQSDDYDLIDQPDERVKLLLKIDLTHPAHEALNTNGWFHKWLMKTSKQTNVISMIDKRSRLGGDFCLIHTKVLYCHEHGSIKDVFKCDANVPEIGCVHNHEDESHESVKVRVSDVSFRDTIDVIIEICGLFAPANSTAVYYVTLLKQFQNHITPTSTTSNENNSKRRTEVKAAFDSDWDLEEDCAVIEVEKKEEKKSSSERRKDKIKIFNVMTNTAKSKLIRKVHRIECSDDEASDGDDIFSLENENLEEQRRILEKFERDKNAKKVTTNDINNNHKHSKTKLMTELQNQGFDQKVLEQMSEELLNPLLAMMQTQLDRQERLEEANSCWTKLKKLREEQDEQLSSKSKCKICYEHEMNILFEPCKHIASCSNCSEKLKDCPICRIRICKKVQCYPS